ncbi:MAG: FkbM family methyltransferase [Bacteroidota bacterium]|nr:FkbM family methyltransferase [Bacteroidota bacterium]
MTITDSRQIIAENGSSFIDNAGEGGVYILGTNKYGASIKGWFESKSIPVHGFINDFTKDASFEALPVVRSGEVPAGQYLVNCVLEGRAVEGYDMLRGLSPKQVTDYFSLQLAFPEALAEVDFMANTASILAEQELYHDLYEQLGDKESKDTLVQLLNFRLNRDVNSLRNFQFRIHEQYFEPFIALPENATFIDGGGFDGATSLYFASLYPKYRSIYFFEPNEMIIPTAKEKLKELPNLHFYEKGLWSSTTTLQFDNTLSSASKLSLEGNISIPTVSIDEIVTDKVDFIKLDIEGAEYEAIIGAKETIVTYKPILAVCVYHAQKDYLRIPSLIQQYRNDYKIYLRHYTQGVFETVMYFI